MSIILILIGLILIFELIRDSARDGDFMGYVNAGNAVLNGSPIYADYLNTWPPFFSIFGVVLALGDSIHPYFIRFIWNLGSIISMFIIIKLGTRMLLNKNIGSGSKDIKIQDPIVVIPLLIIMRFFMDNLSNVQINIYMLLCATLAILFLQRKQYIWLGLVLGLSISLKIYTIFFLLYFAFKREYRAVVWTVVFIAIFNSLSFIVFGFDNALSYYQQWMNEIAPHSYIAHHKNQSLFGALLRLFTTENIGTDLSINILSMDSSIVKKFSYLLVILASVVPAYLFRKKIQNPTSIKSMLEFSLIFTLVPLLSPLAWKYYFIFLWLPYLMVYALVFISNMVFNKKIDFIIKVLFTLSIALNVLTSDLFLGVNLSDITEAYSFITIGTLILLCLQFYLRLKMDQSEPEIELK